MGHPSAFHLPSSILMGHPSAFQQNAAAPTTSLIDLHGRITNATLHSHQSALFLTMLTTVTQAAAKHQKNVTLASMEQQQQQQVATQPGQGSSSMN
eukprot:1155876-Pelagomonas_calceolata.AAC.2